MQKFYYTLKRRYLKLNKIASCCDVATASWLRNYGGCQTLGAIILLLGLL